MIQVQSSGWLLSSYVVARWAYWRFGRGTGSSERHSGLSAILWRFGNLIGILIRNSIILIDEIEGCCVAKDNPHGTRIQCVLMPDHVRFLLTVQRASLLL